jgi:hypothetical protein
VSQRLKDVVPKVWLKILRVELTQRRVFSLLEALMSTLFMLVILVLLLGGGGYYGHRSGGISIVGILIVAMLVWFLMGRT